MTWLRIDDGFPEHERIDPLTAHAFRLHVTALCFCAKHLTDGLLRAKDVRVLLIRAGARTKHVAELVKAGVWVEDDGDYHVRDYLDYNPSSHHVKQERARAAERMRAARAARSPERSPERADEVTAHVRLPHPIPSHTSTRTTNPAILPSPATDGQDGRKFKMDILKDVM